MSSTLYSPGTALCGIVVVVWLLGAATPSVELSAATSTQEAGARGATMPPAEGRGQGRGARGGGQPGGLPAVPFDDQTGFKPIFDGKTLSGWDGDPALWRVERGAVVGETTAAAPLKQNSFLIWRGGEPADFELKLEFRINATNSGVQYRSTQVPPAGDIGRWVLKGYQADIDYNNQYTGMLYEERGRTFLAPRGTFGYVGPNQPPPGQRGQPPASGSPPPGPRGIVGQLENGDALKAVIKQDDWNQFHIVARGNMLVHVLNGHVTALFLDDDPAGRSMKGLLGLQIHTGPPMKVEFRNIWLKTL